MASVGRHLLGAVAVVLAGAGWARAQYAPSIPFAPYAAPYQTFSYPTMTNPSLPNQARLQAFGPGLGGGVSMDLPSTPDLSSIDPFGTLGRPAGGRFMPYHAAFRTPNRFDSKYVQRDQEFAENQARRDELFFQLRSEQDPKRREELSKELAEVNEALRKEGASGRRTAATSRSSGTRTNAGSTTTATAPKRRTSRGTPMAVPDGTRRAETGRAPATPPAAGTTSRVTGERRAGRGTPLTVPASEAAAAPDSEAATTPDSDSADAADETKDVDPSEVLERSRRLDSASGLGLPPLGSGGYGAAAGGGGARTGGRPSSVFGGGGGGGAFSGAPKPSAGGRLNLPPSPTSRPRTSAGATTRTRPRAGG